MKKMCVFFLTAFSTSLAFADGTVAIDQKALKPPLASAPHQGGAQVFFPKLKAHTGQEGLQKQTGTARLKLAGVQNQVEKIVFIKPQGAPTTTQTEDDNIAEEVEKLKKQLQLSQNAVEASLLQKQAVEAELRAAKAESLEMRTELERMRTALSANGQERLLELADTGDVVYLPGVGEVRLGAGFGKSVIRVPRHLAQKADTVFEKAFAERVVSRNHIYYVADSRMLSKY